ncbi:MAG: hypothetical protein ACRCWF_07140 [Beijerinckiaceae bacterium]
MVSPEIVDSLSVAGNRTKVNDDCFGMAGNRVWVIDGATGLGEQVLPCQSDAAWLSRTANRLLHTHHAVRDTQQLIRVVIEGLNSAFTAEQIQPVREYWQLPFASLLMVTIEDSTVEAVWLGDCRAILQIGDQLLTVGENAEGEADERAYASSLAQGTGATAMLRTPSVIASLRESRNTYNTGHGRWTLGLQPAAADNMQRAVFPITGSVTGLAMSDGFSALELKYARLDAANLLKQAETRGLTHLAGVLRHIEEVEDPEGATFPRFKQSDDATAVLFRCDPRISPS